MHMTTNQIAKSEKAQTPVLAKPGAMGLEQAVAQFRATFGQFGATLVERITIVQEYRAANPDMSKSKAFETLANGISESLGKDAPKYTGWKRATLERLGLIGDVFAHNGWTLDARTAQAAWALVEDNRKGFAALGESKRARALSALDTLASSTEKAKAEKAAADKAARDKAKADKAAEKAAAEQAGRDAATDEAPAVPQYTPAALVASLGETVSAQAWTKDDTVRFAAMLREYAATLDSVAELVES